jgi:hypothetical protein
MLADNKPYFDAIANIDGSRLTQAQSRMAIEQRDREQRLWASMRREEAQMEHFGAKKKLPVMRLAMSNSSIVDEQNYTDLAAYVTILLQKAVSFWKTAVSRLPLKLLYVFSRYGYIPSQVHWLTPRAIDAIATLHAAEKPMAAKNLVVAFTKKGLHCGLLMLHCVRDVSIRNLDRLVSTHSDE